MRAFFVEDGTIDLAVKGFQILSGKKMNQEDATKCGREYLELNKKAMNERYGNDSPGWARELNQYSKCIDQYVYREPYKKENGDVVKVWITKAIRSLAYQCSEVNDPVDMRLYRELEDQKEQHIENTGLRYNTHTGGMDGTKKMVDLWEKAPWSFCRDDIVKKEKELSKELER